jgi:hypothetical protein
MRRHEWRKIMANEKDNWIKLKDDNGNVVNPPAEGGVVIIWDGSLKIAEYQRGNFVERNTTTAVSASHWQPLLARPK